MGPIVCATRGGEASRRTQDRAIALARHRGDPLIFLFVADTDFTHPANPALAEALVDGMEQLGRRLVRIAQARAQEQGITAEMVVRRGSVRQTIEDLLRERKASALVLGAPRSDSERQTFFPGELPEFAQKISQDTGVEVIVVG